jgi:hypothetical protein
VKVKKVSGSISGMMSYVNCVAMTWIIPQQNRHELFGD